MRNRTLALIAAAAATAVASLTSEGKAQTVYYRPVVSLAGDGTAADSASNVTNTTNNGATSTIQVFNYSLAAQSAPLGQSSYLNDGSANSLVVNPTSATESQLTNNPGLADAATQGLPYAGTGYVFSGGYTAADGTANVNFATVAANRVIGYMSVTGNSVSGGTIGATSTYANAYGGASVATTAGGNIRGVVGDDTASNFWASGTGTISTTAAIRYANTNTQLETFTTNSRQVQIRQGQLYMGADSGQLVGIGVVGVGTPTTGTPNNFVSSLFETGGTILANGTTAGNSSLASPYAFVLMKDPNNSSTPTVVEGTGATAVSVSVPFNVAYIADDGTSTVSAGLQKWVYSPSTTTNNGWSLAYTIHDANATGGFIGLSAEMVTNPNPALDSVQLFATNNVIPTTSAGNELEQFTDPLEATTATSADNSLAVLATAPANDGFRGVALAAIVPITSQWGVNNSGTWSVGTNWTGSTPGTFGDLADTAVFAGSITSNQNVTLDSNRTVGHIVFNNASASYTIGTTGVTPPVLTIDNTGGTGVPDITVQAGSHAINAPISLAGGVTVNLATGTSLSIGNTITGSGNTTVTGGGKLNIAVGGKLNPSGNLSITSGATVALATGSGVQTVTGLTIDSTSTLDIGNNHVFIDYGSGADPIASIAALIASGFHNSSSPWTGLGITSSAALANSASYGIGYADYSDPGNPAGLTSGEIEIKFTLLGDANLDGAVNGSDFAIMASNFNKADLSGHSGWDEGDFNYDGSVNGADFASLASNFNKGASLADVAALDSFAASNGLLTSVPEPASFAALTVGAAALATRRRRSR